MDRLSSTRRSSIASQFTPVPSSDWPQGHIGDKLRTDEYIFHSEKQLKKEYDNSDNIDSLDTKVADEEAIKAND